MSYGPYLSHIVQKRTVKEWPPKYPDFEKERVRIQQVFDLGYAENSLMIWLYEYKLYGAEWQEEKDWLVDYMGWIIYHKYSWLKNEDQT